MARLGGLWLFGLRLFLLGLLFLRFLTNGLWATSAWAGLVAWAVVVVILFVITIRV